MFLCVVHLRRLSYLSLLFSRTLHSVGCIFPFLPYFLLLFSQLFGKPPQFICSVVSDSSSEPRFTFLHFFSLSDGFGHRLLYNVTSQAPPSMDFSRQEHWSGLPLPPPGGLPDPGTGPRSPALAGRFFPLSVTREPWDTH